ncbi:MAG: hypothetical protein IJK74_07330 [Bacteroidales bacterium]|nr:hypothetical protein [Bacteroidales bacterium]
MRQLSRIIIVVIALIFFGFSNKSYSQTIDVKKMSIYFTYYPGGYALATGYVSFMNQDSVFRRKEYRGENEQLFIPDSINAQSLRKLFDTVRNNHKKLSDVFKITEEDYEEYRKGLDSISKDDTFFIIPDFILREKGYDEKSFKALKYSDFIMPDYRYLLILNSDSKYLLEGGLVIRITIIDSEYNIIKIQPLTYHEGTPWVCSLENGNTYYIDNNTVITFLKENRLDHIPFFLERFYLMFKIAEKLIDGKY